MISKKEGIREEIEVVLLTWNKPSQYFEGLKENDNLNKYFPELKSLIGIIQSPIHHPEGDVWNHTMLVIDEASKLKNKSSYPLGFMLSALCHDFGKVKTTRIKEDGKIISYNHERVGLNIVSKFLNRITTNNETDLKNYVLNMTELHMQPNQLANQNSKLKSTRKLFSKSICPNDLVLLAKADALGRTIEQDYSTKEQYLMKGLEDFYNHNNE